jgi:hypothetical protein
MPDVPMTGYTAALLILMNTVDLTDHRLMAAYTILLDDLGIALTNSDRGREIAGGKSQAVIKTIDCFSDPFADEIVGHMTIIADRDRFVAALPPGFELIAHDMTVDAGSGVI